MVGKVIIGTELDSRQLEKDLKSAEKDLRNYEKEAEKLTKAQTKAEIDLKPYQEAIELIKQETDESLKYAQTAGEVDTLLKTETSQIEELNSKYSEQLKKLEDIKSAINTNSANQTIMADKVRETNNQINKVKGFERIKGSVDDINKGLKTTLKRVVRWGIAIFGVRTAYTAVSSAMSTLSQYDETMKSNLEYIKTSVATSLKPLIESILSLIVKLLQYINYIAKAWTGKDLFASANAFKQMQKNAQGTAKATKDIKKQLVGFDEMNVLSDTSASGGEGGFSTPNVDLTGMEGEIPEWVKWIVNNKDLLVSTLLGIASTITLINLGLDGFKALGIGLIIAGIYETIMGIVSFIQDPSWENFSKILKGLTLILTGLAVAMLAVNAANPTAWIILAIALVTALVALIIDKWDEIKATLGKVGDWINEHIIKPVADFFKGLWEGIKSGVGEAVQWVKDKFQTVVSFFSNLISKIVGLFKKIGTKVGNAIGGAFKSVINGVLSAIENILNFPIRQINKLINIINKVPGIEIDKLSTFSLPRLAKGGIVNQPSKGVPIGSAITGERGAEGVIPLTDSQQMELLGQAIGKYITLNASIPVYVGNRQIAKEIRKINAESDFAYNR